MAPPPPCHLAEATGPVVAVAVAVAAKAVIAASKDRSSKLKMIPYLGAALSVHLFNSEIHFFVQRVVRVESRE